MGWCGYLPVSAGGQRYSVLKKGWTMGPTTGPRKNTRAIELHHLRLALATFALQLDAFEMRANGALLAAGRGASPREASACKAPVRKASIAVPRADQSRDSEGRS
jgi:hypothetical protein